MLTPSNCTNCNAALDDGAQFCVECGTKVETVPQEAPEAPGTVYEDIFCPECGKKTTTEYAFCPECGKPISEVQEVAPLAKEMQADVYEDIFCPECGKKTTTEYAFCPECGKPIGAAQEEVSTVEPAPEKKKSTLPIKPLYIGIAAVAVLVIVAAVAIFSKGGGSSKGNQIIYAKSKEIYFTNLSKLNPFQLTDRFNDSSYDISAVDYGELSPLFLMSDNGRYIFYPDRLDSNDGASYYWRDLNNKKDESNKVDSELSDIPQLTKDGGKLFYTKGDDSRLYIYDRKSGEKNKLADEVESFYVNETGDYLLYDTYVDDEYAIYEVTIKNLNGEKNKLDSDAGIYAAFADEKKVYYLKDDTLYFKEYNKEKVKIASDVDQVVSIVDGKSVYYIKTEEVTNNLSDFITDDMADDDKNANEPVMPSIKDAPEYPSQYDYMKADETWYPSYWGSETHPITGESGYWNQEVDWDAFDKATEKFEQEYAEWEKEANKLWDEYSVAMELYEGRSYRDELRDAIEDDDNAVTYNKYNLHYWTQSGDTLVASDLSSGSYRNYLTASSEIPVVIYQKYNTSDGGNQKLSELLSGWGGYFYVDDVIYDIRNKVSSKRNTSNEIYVASEDKESVLECEKARSFSIHKSGTIYFLDDYNNNKGYGMLMSSSVSKGSAATPVKIDDDVMSFCFGNENDNAYYYKDVKDDKGDLYMNGKALASDVYMPSLYNYEGTNTLLYYTDYSSKNESGTLCIFNGSNQTKISDDISYFTPIDEKNVAYLSDYNRNRERGELMLYSGGDKQSLVDSDVTALIRNPNMIWSNYNWDSYVVPAEPATAPAPADEAPAAPEV